MISITFIIQNIFSAIIAMIVLIILSWIIIIIIQILKKLTNIIEPYLKSNNISCNGNCLLGIYENSEDNLA